MRYRLRTLLNLLTRRVGLLDKRNPKATLRSVLIRAAVAAAIGSIAFLILFRHSSREAWMIGFPLWVLLNAAIGALAEWQIGDDFDLTGQDKQ